MAEETVQSKRLQRIYENAKRSLSIETQVRFVGRQEPTTMYHMDISFKSSRNKWSIFKRYSEFFKVRRTLKKFLKHNRTQLSEGCPMPLKALETALDANFPRRHLRGDNAAIVEERKRALEAFVQQLVKVISCIPLSDSSPIHAATSPSEPLATTEKDAMAMLYQILRDFLMYPDKQIESETKLKLAVLSLEDVVVSSQSNLIDTCEWQTECCSICLGDWHEEECADMNIVKLPCMHAFHEDCLMEWLQSNTHCPMCRDEPTPSTSPAAGSASASASQADSSN